MMSFDSDSDPPSSQSSSSSSQIPTSCTELTIPSTDCYHDSISGTGLATSFPVELIDEIIDIAISSLLGSYDTDSTMHHPSSSLSPIAPFTFLSTWFRYVATRKYLRRLVVMEPEKWGSLDRFLLSEKTLHGNGHVWVK